MKTHIVVDFFPFYFTVINFKLLLGWQHSLFLTSTGCFFLTVRGILIVKFLLSQVQTEKEILLAWLEPGR